MTSDTRYGEDIEELKELATTHFWSHSRQAADMSSSTGVKITRPPGPMKHGTRVIAFCEDPDGYKVELNEKIKLT